MLHTINVRSLPNNTDIVKRFRHHNLTIGFVKWANETLFHPLRGALLL